LPAASAAYAFARAMLWAADDTRPKGKGFFGEFFDGPILKKVLPGLIREGAKNTLVFTFFAFVGGMFVGLLLALARGSKRRWLRWPAATFVDFFRGLPLTLVIVFIGFGLPIAYRNIQGSFFRWPLGNFGATFVPGVVALSLVAGAYISETIRAGIEGVPRGQMEAARSLGMPYTVAMRKVVLPQAFRLNLGPLTNELALLFKDTSQLAVLGATLGGKEITKFARDMANTSSSTTPLVAAGLVYLVITIPLLRVAAWLERRVKAGTR
jgi:polar amino acid transport system permease protein